MIARENGIRVAKFSALYLSAKGLVCTDLGMLWLDLDWQM